MKRFLPLLLLLAALIPASAQEDKDLKQITRLEIQNIRDAMQFFYLDYNEFTTIENLDDTFSTTINPPHQRINDEGGALLIRPQIGTVRKEFLVKPISSAGPPYLTRSSGNQYEGPNGNYDEGTPLDPWLNPYYFYSPLGLVEPKSERVSQRFFGDQFDFYTVVSHGPDGEPGGGDDFYEQIFIQITATTISSAKAEPAPGKFDSPWRIPVRGYNLGDSNNAGVLLINGAEHDATLVQWTESLVVFDVGTLPPEGSALSLKTGGGLETRSVPLIYIQQPLAAENWALYR